MKKKRRYRVFKFLPIRASVWLCSPRAGAVSAAAFHSVGDSRATASLSCGPVATIGPVIRVMMINLTEQPR